MKKILLLQGDVDDGHGGLWRRHSDPGARCHCTLYANAACPSAKALLSTLLNGTKLPLAIELQGGCASLTAKSLTAFLACRFPRRLLQCWECLSVRLF